MGLKERAPGGIELQSCMCQKPQFAKDRIKSDRSHSWWTTQLPGSASHPHFHTQLNGWGWAFMQTFREQGLCTGGWKTEKRREKAQIWAPLIWGMWEGRDLPLRSPLEEAFQASGIAVDFNICSCLQGHILNHELPWAAYLAVESKFAVDMVSSPFGHVAECLLISILL